MGNINKKVSVCITVFNESEETIKKLTSALNNQTLKADEIIIIDAKDYGNCSRSRGRNIAISKARNEIIAITDAGCVPHREWLFEITRPFEIASSQVPRNDIVVAGGYKMIVKQSLPLRGKNSFQKACSVFLGVKQKNIDNNFMPSARSMAFTKSIWKKAGGFPEKLIGTAEDTVFDVRLLKSGAKFVVVKNAIVDWQMPSTIYDFGYKIYRYAKGDAESGIWWHPVKKLKTHNIKILTIFARYFLFIYLSTTKWQALLICLFVYLIFAYSKARWWGIILQFVSDFSCIIGFSHGIFSNCVKRA